MHCNPLAAPQFERDEKEYFRRHKTFKFQDTSARVSSIAMSQNDENLIISVVGGQAYSLAISTNASDTGPSDQTFEPLGGAACHAATVTGMDVAVRKPWMVTCSVDKTVRVWNFLDRSIELSKTFREEAYSVAIHPAGLMVLVSDEPPATLGMNKLILLVGSAACAALPAAVMPGNIWP